MLVRILRTRNFDARGSYALRAVKGINSNARRLRSPFKRSHVLTGSNGF
jgi:hypothetical protein